MEVKTLFDEAAYAEIVERVNKLTPDTQRLWGKMTASQMLAHLKEAFKVPLTEKPLPRIFIGRLVSWLAKSKLYDSTIISKNLPTAPSFKIRGDRDFEEEKKALLSLVDQFHSRGPEQVGNYPHPFFGTLTKDQWGKSMWKHLDHHLRQFGV